MANHRVALKPVEKLCVAMLSASAGYAAQHSPGYLSMVLNVLNTLSEGRLDEAARYIQDFAEREK